MKKVLLVTFSDNADHQDITFGMYESLYKENSSDVEVWLIAKKDYKVSISNISQVYFVDCPQNPGIEKKTFDLQALYRIVRWIKKQKFEVVFFETLHVWNLAIMVWCHKNTRVIQMIHDLIPHQGDKHEKGVRLMNRIVCKIADNIVLVNQKYIPMVTQLYGVSLNHVCCVDMWRRFPHYTEPRFTKRVLFFGRLNPYKGIDNLCEIVRLCPNVQFDIVGRADSQIQGYIDQLKRMPNVFINNSYVTEEEMQRVFQNADWVILPYNTATQSGVVIDGYRYGKPCIAFDVGAISEQIEDGKSGYLISNGDIDAFVKCIHIVQNYSREKYAEMSKYAYEYGKLKYDVYGAKDRIEQLMC